MHDVTARAAYSGVRRLGGHAISLELRALTSSHMGWLVVSHARAELKLPCAGVCLV